MKFDQIPTSSRVFIDANTFVYHFGNHPEFGAECTSFLGRIPRGEVFGFTSADILRDVAISQQNGLLSGDALIVAVMRTQGISDLASHDSDFDRVPGLTRYAPA